MLMSTPPTAGMHARASNVAKGTVLTCNIASFTTGCHVKLCQGIVFHERYNYYCTLR